MAKLVIEVPEELRGLGEAFATMVARVQGPVAGTRGGTAVDYGQVEQTIAEEAGGIELAAHRTILEALDVDVPTVIIGGLRYTKVGRCEAPYHTLAGSVSIERSLDRQSGQRGGHPGGRVVDPVSLRAGVVGAGLAAAHGAGDGPPGATGALARRGGDGRGVRPPALLAVQRRAGRPSGGRAGGGGSPGQRGRVDRHLRGALRGAIGQCVARPRERTDGGAAAPPRRPPAQGGAQAAGRADVSHGVLWHGDAARRAGGGAPYDPLRVHARGRRAGDAGPVGARHRGRDA